MTRTLLPTGLRRTSCSILALATVMTFGATPAYAQFVGTIDSSSGIDTVNSTNSNLLITGNQAVINWTANGSPSGGQIEFLPDSNSVTFSSGSDFAVLNRVTPGTSGNAIYMGGNISSFAGDFTGGTVYFYSPNGIVIGANEPERDVRRGESRQLRQGRQSCPAQRQRRRQLCCHRGTRHQPQRHHPHRRWRSAGRG